jgi:hypothetical protein
LPKIEEEEREKLYSPAERYAKHRQTYGSVAVELHQLCNSVLGFIFKNCNNQIFKLYTSTQIH